jgi:uncharacterized membrane protein
VPRAPGPGRLEDRIARLLRIGTYTAVALVAVGVILLIAAGRSPLEVAPVLDPGAILGDLAKLRPAPFLWLGIFVVLATPSARVIAALAGFVRAGEREMAFVAALILAVIALGVVVGTAGG